MSSYTEIQLAHAGDVRALLAHRGFNSKLRRVTDLALADTTCSFGTALKRFWIQRLWQAARCLHLS